MWKTNKKKGLVIALIVGILTVGAFAFRTPEHPAKPQHPNNLKVLPKDITHDELMEVMESFESALNYTCGDCHARSTTDSTELNFKSNANPQKFVALQMMKMVKKINEENFRVKGDFKENYLTANYKVTCNTCHRGAAIPAAEVPVKVIHPEKD